MRITIAGGSGFLGSALTGHLLADGHDVTLLARAPGRSRGPAHPRLGLRPWAPDGTAGAWVDAVDGADAVINLAGEPIAAGRWTTARKAAILQSRLLSTRSLVLAVTAAQQPPPLFVNASATGYYGSRGDEILAEDSLPGHDFLAGVCRAWENEASKVPPTVRLVLLRTGLVLDRHSGALPRMALPFRLFGGGPLGSGNQYVPWVHAADWVRLVCWVLRDERADGAVNVTSPEPVRNRDFSAALGRALHRPAWLRAPASAMRLALGDMADGLLLASTRAVPEKPRALGFEFRFRSLDTALAALFG